MRLALCALASGASACSGDLPEESAPRCVAPDDAELQRLEGIYEMHYRTHNADACDAEGPSQLEWSENKWLAVRRSQDAAPALLVGECQDLERCREVASGREVAAFSGHGRYDCSIGDGSLYGRSREAGSLEDGSCKLAVHADGFMIPEGDGALRIESKVRMGDYPAPPRGCSLAAAAQASAAMPCSYHVYRATRVEPL